VNAINLIAPYRLHGMWVFDDARRGLVEEPFVGGADQMIDRVVADLPSPEAGFVMMFSADPFPGSRIVLEWRRAEGAGNVYYAPELDAEGWLCPALLRYFEAPPPMLHVAVRARQG